jgi:hypothetical protein
MSVFEQREDAFEAQFAHEEEIRFRARARRDKLLGLWAADRMGLVGDDARAYATDLVMSDLTDASDEAIASRILSDLAIKDCPLSPSDLHAKMTELHAQAFLEIRAGI